MKLKVKIIDWSAGFPVVMIDKDTSIKLGVHPSDRVLIRTLKKPIKELVTIADLADNFFLDNEILISSEIKDEIFLKEGQEVEISLASQPKSLYFIKNKVNGKRLSELEINIIIKDILANRLSDSEVSLFISSMYNEGMNMQEIIYLTKAMLKSGNRISFKEKLVVDKHCIGGIPGNRTTPIVVSICAAAGLIFPKNSSRAITSAAGTADVIETIAKIEFSEKELKKIIKKTNACFVWGGVLGMAPADSKIIKVEKTLGVDPEAQLLASIISKKLASGGKYILIDIPYGAGSKLTKKEAFNLKKKFEYIGKYFKVNLKAVLTKGNEPIGNGVGPALELIDVMRVLDPDQESPKDLEKKSIFLASEIFELCGKAKKGEGIKLAREILNSGKAFRKFKEIIKAQKGKIRRIKLGKFRKDILSSVSGKISKINNPKINSLARVTGCPSDKYSGVYIHHHIGEKVKKGEKLLTIFSESISRLKEASKFYDEEKSIVIHNYS